MVKTAVLGGNQSEVVDEESQHCEKKRYVYMRNFVVPTW